MRLPVRPDQFLVTVHQAENALDKTPLKGIISGIPAVNDAYDLPLVFPMRSLTT